LLRTMREKGVILLRRQMVLLLSLRRQSVFALEGPIARLVTSKEGKSIATRGSEVTSLIASEATFGMFPRGIKIRSRLFLHWKAWENQIRNSASRRPSLGSDKRGQMGNSDRGGPFGSRVGQRSHMSHLHIG
jgi:hypothetical protein